MEVRNYVRQVFCPTKGRMAAANSTAKAELRCTACGNVHVEAKRFVADFVPISGKKKKFKKGKKPKKKA